MLYFSAVFKMLIFFYFLAAFFEHIEVDALGENFYISLDSLERLTLDWKHVSNGYDIEKKYYDIKNVNKYQFDGVQPGKEGQTGHFTQIVWAKTYLMGCASTYFMNQKERYPHVVIAACLYGPVGNVNNQPVYLHGTPCSKCSDGGSCSSTYPGLCSSGNLPRPKPSDFPAGFEEHSQQTNISDYNKGHNGYSSYSTAHLSSKHLPRCSSVSQTKQEYWYLIVAFGSVVFLA